MTKKTYSEENGLQNVGGRFLVKDHEELDLVSYLSPKFDAKLNGQDFSFLEFFCGGGMARLGLGKAWQCLMANDWDSAKAESYLQNFKTDTNFIFGDIFKLDPTLVPGPADLAWASFPCQDLSLAGNGKGLNGAKSGAFWGFTKVIKSLLDVNKAPKVLALENVVGTLTSHDGKDFQVIVQTLVDFGYRVGAVVLDGAHFVPQSRPRLFIVAVHGDGYFQKLELNGPSKPWHTSAIERAYSNFPKALKQSWVWWKVGVPGVRTARLEDIVLRENPGVAFHTEFETKKLLAMMSPINKERVESAKRKGGFQVGAVYKRTRMEGKKKHQRAEVRFDGLSGCLRTPSGGSSRQLLVLVENGKVKSRLLAMREAARLMGVLDSYKLPESYNQAYHLMGDGLVVPVIAWLEKNLLRRLAHELRELKEDAA